MLTKTTFALIAAVVVATASSAYAQGFRQNYVGRFSDPSAHNEEIRLDHAKGDVDGG